MIYSVNNETFSRVRRLHEPRGSRACGTSLRHKTTRRGRTQAHSGKSEPSRPEAETEAKSYEAFRLSPRGSVLVGIRFFPHLAGDFSKGQALSDNARSEFAKAVTVIHVLPIVEPKSLLIDVTKQVEWFHANVRAVQSALQEAPKVLHAVSVNVSTHVLLCMVNDLMRVLAVHLPVVTGTSE